MLGIVLFNMDKEQITTARTYWWHWWLNLIVLIFFLEFLTSWKWTRAYILILVGISAIVAGTAAIMVV